MRNLHVGEANEDTVFVNDGKDDVATINRTREFGYPDGNPLSDLEWQEFINLVHGSKKLLDTMILMVASLKTAAHLMRMSGNEEEAKCFDTDIASAEAAIEAATRLN